MSFRSQIPIYEPLYVEGEAPKRFAEPSGTEISRMETDPERPDFPRVIGGDRADLAFSGYRGHLGKTYLEDPHLITRDSQIAQLPEAELHAIAEDILSEAVASTGHECLYK